MNRKDFFIAADQLSNWTDTLKNQVESMLTQAEDELCQKHGGPCPVAPSSQTIVTMGVRSICQRIEEVMFAYDHLLVALDHPPQYEMFFRYLDAPRAVQERVRQTLKNP